jgi:hypothetical protein
MTMMMMMMTAKHRFMSVRSVSETIIRNGDFLSRNGSPQRPPSETATVDDGGVLMSILFYSGESITVIVMTMMMGQSSIVFCRCDQSLKL